MTTQNFVMTATKDQSRTKALATVILFLAEAKEAKDALALVAGTGTIENKYVQAEVVLTIDKAKLEKIARRRAMRARIVERFAQGGKVQFFDHDRKVWRDVANPKFTGTATYRDIFEVRFPEAEKMLGIDEFGITEVNKRESEIKLQGILGKAVRLVG